MNKDFKARNDEVIRIFSFLAKEATERKGKLVFFGGSAVQQILKDQKRFSVDLDVFYPAEPSELMGVLESEGYAVTRSRTVNPLFSFYNTTKDGVKVKVQFMRGTETEVPSQSRQFRSRNNTFMGYVATPAYLIASKLSALALGTIGRKKEREIGLIKDVFDFNCLIDEFGVPNETWSHLPLIISAQNRVWKKNYGENEVFDSIEKTLLRTASIGKESLITTGTLGNFDQFLPGGHIKKYEFVGMVYRVLAVMQTARHAIKTGKDPAAQIKKVEQTVAKQSADASFVIQFEKELIKKEFDTDELHELKFFSPKALLYLAYAELPKLSG